MKNDYIVVCQAPSQAVFSRTDAMTNREFNTPSGKVDVTFRTHYEQHKDGGNLARHLYAEISGNALSIEGAINDFWNGANHLIPLIAFATNAYIEDLEFELAYDNTPNHYERDFFQSFLTLHRGIPKRGRLVDVDTTILLMKSVSKHPEYSYILRAVEQYRRALLYWRPGMETFALAHLFMSAETLKLGICNQYIRTTGLSEVDLANSWNKATKRKNGDALPLDIIRNELEATIRSAIIFQGDKECHHEAKKASDEFEHGSGDFRDIYQRAKLVRDKTANYIRYAILSFISTVGVDLTRLMGSPYEYPLERIDITRYLKGKLVGTSNVLAEKGYDYPWFEMNTSFKPSIDKDGKDAITFEQTATAHLGEEVVFQGTSFEIWGAKE